ncbi:MAG TPA: molybdate ABC transporter substrate-binding protein [Actinomycetota bacterium]|jgi:molybdate transport system substrate-binding protein
MRRWSAVLGCAALILTACGSDDGSGDGGATAELTVFAASSLTDAFTEIGSDFEAANDGVAVIFNFGSSGELAAQIASEGTADVFASASESYMDDVSADPGVTGRTDFAQNRLVVITPPDNPADIRSFEDLGNPGVQVVLAAEGVPVGDYAREALDAAGIGDAVLANVVSNEEDNASVVAKIISGEADAAIVYVSDVTSQVAPDVDAIDVPDAVNVIAAYPIAVVEGAQDPETAQAFVDFATGPEGQATLAAFGFLPPPSA